MRITLDPSEPFNLEATLCCGQTFRWDRHGEWWYGAVGENVFKVCQIGDFLEIENAGTHFARKYFGLNDNLDSVLSQISKDEHIKQAIDMFRGLRILRQDPWECLISYICATYKNIAAIKQMLNNLCRRYGDRVCLDGHDFYTFPTPEKLLRASMNELAGCSLGYRAKYVHETARMVHGNLLQLEHLKKAAYQKARRKLISFPGVGLKAADCISLFSLEKLQAFPVDVWIKKAIMTHYKNHFSTEFNNKIRNKSSLTTSQYERLSLFGREYFGRFAGYAQEYLYHYERTQQKIRPYVSLG
jgi:N-glycosylase/DNA lyase